MIFKDHIPLGDYEIPDGENLELYPFLFPALPFPLLPLLPPTLVWMFVTLIKT